jgi:hypothetical protein
MSDDNTSGNSPNSQVEGMQAIADQLKAQNEAFKEIMTKIAAPPQAPQQVKQVEIDPYNPESIKQFLAEQTRQISDQASRTVDETLKRERALNATVGRLAQEYPEINSDPAIMKEVINEHNRLSAGLKETAEGYELAIQRVVSAKNLVPKSRRQASQTDDFSASGSGNRGGRQRGSEKKEVSDTTKTVSALLGRDTDSDEYKKNMEQVQSRKSFHRYE